MEKEKKKKKDSRGKGSGRGRVLREFSSGGVVFKKIKQQSGSVDVLWLVAHSKPSKEYPFDVWRLPKGWIDDDGDMPGSVARGDRKATEIELQEVALREVNEEAGVRANIVKKIGTEMFVFNSKLRKAKVLKFVTFYLMQYVKDLGGGFGEETSEISWLKFDEARKKLTHSGEKKIMDVAKKIFDSLAKS